MTDSSTSDAQLHLGFFDGACEPNPGHGGVGWHIQTQTGEEVASGCAYIGNVTNNVAEYHALLHLLQGAVEAGITHLHVRGDSDLIIKQVQGVWKAKKEHLAELRDLVWEWKPHFEHLEFEWIRRDFNKRADDLSKQALVEAGLLSAYTETSI